jgi:hypothetical protein
MDQEWDEKSWREVGEGCMAKGIYASCVVAGREEDSELSRSLRILCQEASRVLIAGLRADYRLRLMGLRKLGLMFLRMRMLLSLALVLIQVRKLLSR